MVQMVIYPPDGSFMGRLAIQTIREHLCGYYEQKVTCTGAQTRLDPQTGHRVCSGCRKILVSSGLRSCDICGRDYIDPTKYQNPRYETNCPCCVVKYGLEDE
jgi:hypothetical protein